MSPGQDCAQALLRSPPGRHSCHYTDAYTPTIHSASCSHDPWIARTPQRGNCA
jgi:hypothetical protein